MSTPMPRLPGVLLVDDEAVIRDVLSLGLRRQGFLVLTAAGGREAIDIYGRQRDAIDVVLLDLAMPGLDGHETIAALEQINPAVRCCIMSGTTPAGGGTLDDIPTVGKPFAMSDLVGVLRDLLGTGTPLPEQAAFPVRSQARRE